MNKHKEYLKDVQDTCLRCHLCSCYNKSSSVGELGFGEIAERLLAGMDKDLENTIFGCHQCGLCLKKCPKKFNAKEFMSHARGFMEEKENSLCAFYAKVRVDKEENLFSSLRKQNGIHYEDALLENEECSRLFVPGCHLASSLEAITKKVTNLLKGKDLIDGMTAICCGNPLYASGQTNACKQYLQKLECLYQKHHVRSLITPCPSCYDFYLRAQKWGYLKDIKVICLSQYLAENGIHVNRNQFAKNYVISIHDSCPDRMRGIFAASIRSLYKDFEIKELPHVRERTLCCGCGGLVPMYSVEISKEGKQAKLEDYMKIQSDCVITTCCNCKKGLTGLMPIRHYLEDLVKEEE